MLMIAVADLAIATSQSTFGLSVTLHQPLGIAPLGLRRRVKARVIRRWLLLQEKLDALLPPRLPTCGSMMPLELSSLGQQALARSRF